MCKIYIGPCIDHHKVTLDMTRLDVKLHWAMYGPT